MPPFRAHNIGTGQVVETFPLPYIYQAKFTQYTPLAAAVSHVLPVVRFVILNVYENTNTKLASNIAMCNMSCVSNVCKESLLHLSK